MFYRFFVLCMFLLSVHYPLGYYATCHENVDISWFHDKSILYYGIVFYLALSIGFIYYKFLYFIVISDVLFLHALLYYFVLDFFTGSIFHGGANLVLDYFFSSFFNVLSQNVACGDQVGLHYQTGYFFYIAFIISFSLSTLLGIMHAINRRRGR